MVMGLGFSTFLGVMAKFFILRVSVYFYVLWVRV